MECNESPRFSSQIQNSCINQDSKPLEVDQQEGAKRSSNLPKRSIDNAKRFLGVRQRPSGRWVAEIKGTSQKLRLWLGTFDRAEEAAMAYDYAARLLRGRNAKTNFPYHEIMKTHEGNCSLVGKNPRFYQLLRQAIMKNHAKTSFIIHEGRRDNEKRGNQLSSIEFNSLVEETIVCASSSYEVREGQCGFSFGRCKVYSSVVVAPSFSSLSQKEEEEEKKCEEIQSLGPLLLHENGLIIGE